MFPFLNQKLDFHTEIDQHKVIFSSVEKIIATVTLYQSDLTKYDPEYLKSLMVALRDPLVSPSSHAAPKSLREGRILTLNDIDRTLRRRSSPLGTREPQGIWGRRDQENVP